MRSTSIVFGPYQDHCPRSLGGWGSTTPCHFVLNVEAHSIPLRSEPPVPSVSEQSQLRFHGERR